MALTSAERQSFEHIVLQLRTTDRWFTWRTKPTTRRSLWLRRQVWHLISPPVFVWALLIATITVTAHLAVVGSIAVGRGARTECVAIARLPGVTVHRMRAHWMKS